MKEFEIIHKGRDFEIRDKEGSLGKLTHIKWSSEKAEIVMGNGQNYVFDTKSFWKAINVVYQNDKELFEIKQSWSGGATITPLKEQHHFYTINHMGWFKQGNKLLTHKQEEVEVITSAFSWKGMYTAYTLTCNDNFGTTETEQLMLLLLVRQYMDMQRAAAAAGTS